MNTHDMPCDVCGEETGQTEWVGPDDKHGQFLCPLCKLLSPRERFNVSVTLAREELNRLPEAAVVHPGEQPSEVVAPVTETGDDRCENKGDS